ncbi:signal peptidase II [Massilia sp. G4R7]|uniref:Lipoprotein signal peptidase n=1 Tax=Massilia phyllostachyos TaxID=2898585 RepID=A0ABS8Q1E2_9BURK|nr:signal peptidase II [Massilia phyllostachyos]MCD2515567.1 signal peptidase II [Massilia phyllostachyos]
MATNTKKASPGAKPVYKSSASLLPWFGLALIFVLLDQITKITVECTFAYAETLPITGFFNLIKVYNPGAAFSFLGDASGWQRYFFLAIALAAVGFCLYMMKKNASQRLFCFALALIMAGAIGNGIDRVIHGHVIDFLDFYWTGIGHFPAFNIADIAISVGAFLFVVDELRRVNKS